MTVSRMNLESIFSRLDINHDGVLTYDEFKVFFNYKNYSKITSMENEEYLYKKSFIKNINSYSALSTHLTESNLKNHETENILNTNYSYFENILKQSKRMDINKNNLNKSLNSAKRENISVNNGSISRSGIQLTSYSLSKKYGSIEEEILMNFFNLIISSEKEIERIKIKLAEKIEFNLIDIFQNFLDAERYLESEEDSNYSQKYYLIEKLSLNQFKSGINYFSSYPTEKELKLILNRYFINNLKILDFTNFCNFFLPLDIIYRKLLKERFRNSNMTNKASTPDIKSLVSKLFNKLISIEVNIETWRLKLNKINTFNIKTLYDKINNSNTKFENVISLNDLENYLMSFNIQRGEVGFLFNRIDKSGKNKLIYSDVKFILFYFSFHSNYFLKLYNAII